MSDENKEEIQELDILNMSDEDIENMDINNIVPNEEATDTDEDDSTEDSIEEAQEDDKELDDESVEDDDKASESDDDDATEDASTEEDLNDSDTTEDDDKKDADNVSDLSNAESELAKLFAPFRANGKDMKVDSVDDAISLMKMGAGFNKKMAGLKPNLKLMKMLDNNELLNEDQISYLIDLSKKEPKAIAKLVKESGIDPLELTDEEHTDYTPNKYTVNDAQLELDSVLNDIKDSANYQATVELVSDTWDEASKTVLLRNPSIIKVINDHMDSGIYDKINSEMEKERTLGRLTGLSDVEAYKQIGDAMNARGDFGSADQNETATSTSNQKAKKNKPDPKLKSRKKAASLTKQSPSSSKNKSDFNPLAVSDDEIEKMGIDKFL